MTNNNIHHVLENLISLTSEKETNALELALAQTLFKLAAPETIKLYRASSIDEEKYQNSAIGKHAIEEIESGILDALSECLESKQNAKKIHKGKTLSLFPLLGARNSPIAVVAFEETNNEDGNKERELILMILKVYHNFVTLMNENERDTLTGLLNRKTFDMRINSIISDLAHDLKNRREDTQDEQYLAIFDIDHFKNVNDTFGHLIGDEVLLLFSRLLEKSFRETDILFRFGGEEFVGIFQCPSDEVITKVLNRLRTNIEQYSFPQVGKVTVSCGFTKINKHDLSTMLIDRADVALYYAKHHGRNQVCQHEQLIENGHIAANDNSGEIELF